MSGAGEWSGALGLLEEYITRARWWPWKTGGRRPVLVKTAFVEDIAHLKFSDGDNLYQASFILGDHPGLPSDRLIPYKGRFIYEAEYDKRFLDAVKRVPGVDVELSGDLTPVVVSAKPLTLDSTNVLSLVETAGGERLVLKSYRLLPRVNMEYECLVKLSREGFKNAPRVRGLVYEDGEPIAMLLQYIPGYNDAGYPFYVELTEWLKNPGTRLNVGLSAKLGVITGGLHSALNKPGDRGFFGLEEVSDRDVLRWEERLSKRAKFILEKFDENARVKGLEWLAFWREVFEKRGLQAVEEARSLLDKFVHAYKARIHQDLHLLQMIYDPGENEFYIIDFEGEPGRSLEERLEKEPPLRDVASLVRSFHYLSFAALLNTLGGSVDGLARRVLEEDPAQAWRRTHLTSMVYSYLARTGPLGLHGLGDKLLREVDSLLKPWIVERALYELAYELMYRPDWAPIPLLGLLRLY